MKLGYGADYTQLGRLLAAKQWKEADLETRQLMLEITGAKERTERLLSQNDIQQFPCAALLTIDRLWVESSQDRFGFSVIKRIYQEVDGDYANLAQRVGWRMGDKWIGYNEVNFTSDAPVGHLPITWLVPTSFWMYWLARFASPGWRLLLERSVECKL